jgi:pimeloyl-ACP methyl ester carboxylesterase
VSVRTPPDGDATADDGVTEAMIRIRPQLRLAVRRWHGGETTPTFVLVHGLASNARLWDGVAARLHAVGHRVVALDQRGHGRSDAPGDGYDLATVTDDLRLVLDALDVRRPVLVGQSWGGNVVLEAAARFGGRLAGVVGIDGGTIDLQARFPTWEACAEELAPPSFDGATLPQLEGWFRQHHPDWPEMGIAGAMANFVEEPDGTVRSHLRREHHLQVLHGLWTHRPPERYPAIDRPVLLIPAETGDASWTADKRSDVQVALDALPQGRVHWLVGDHDLHAQQPDVVADVLLDAVADGFLG